MTRASHSSAGILGGPSQPYGAAAIPQAGAGAGVGNPAPEGVRASPEGIGEGNRPPLEVVKNRFPVKKGDIVRTECGDATFHCVVEKDDFVRLSVVRNEVLMEGVNAEFARSAPNLLSRQNLSELFPRIEEEVRDAAESLLLLNPRNNDEPKLTTYTRRPRSARIAR